MNYFELHIGDYQRKTAHLSLAEHGAYNLMLQTFYSGERPLPKDRKVLFRLLRAESKVDKQAVETVIREFWLEGPDGLVNKRASEVVTEYRGWVEQQRANGKRRGKPNVSQASSDGLANGKPNGGTPILTPHLDHDLDTTPHTTPHGPPAMGSPARVGGFKKVGRETWKPPTEEEIRAGK